MNHKPTVVFDFDGVIHSYKSGWQGAEEIPDPVVPGIAYAIEQLRDLGYNVVVVSTRCSSAQGMGAVRRYLRCHGIVVDDVMAEKPPAICYIDDRAICFDGDAGSLVKKVQSFEPWTKGGKKTDSPVSMLRPCKAKIYERGGFREVTGVFHCWGADFEEFETGPGNYSTAIIELDDGEIVSCVANNVKFLDR